MIADRKSLRLSGINEVRINKAVEAFANNPLIVW